MDLSRYKKEDIIEIINKETNEKIKAIVKLDKQNNKFLEKIKDVKTQNKINMIIDSRENINFRKEIHKIEEINLISKNLEIGDIVLDDYLGIERKTQKDFVDSILDKRIFEQLKNLTHNYKRPLLIIEGCENLFNFRNVSSNVILSSILIINIDFRIPILFTKDIPDTINNLLLIVKRRLKLNKNISLKQKKSTKTKKEELENFIASIPNINRTLSKKLLTKFKSIKNIIEANEKEIQTIEGLGNKRANQIYNFFREEY